MIKKKRIVGLLVFAGTLIFMAVFMIGLMGNQRDYQNPTYFWNYHHAGYYEIVPDSILESIDRGDDGVFVPLLDDPNQVKDLNNKISWNQSDYLKVIDALSRVVWNEPLDLEKWQVNYIYFQTGCMNDLHGFRELDIVYFKYSGIKEWKRIYSSRIVGISPWKGVVRWGDAVFAAPIVSPWRHVNLPQFSITADRAFQVAEENGGIDTRLRNGNSCGISVKAPFNGLDDSWSVDYHSGVDFTVIVNPYSGKNKILH
jgi:hypothetical protein